MPHSSFSPQKCFSRKATMSSKSIVDEVEKDLSCTARLCSLLLIIGCTINNDQALSKALVNLSIWKMIVASCDAFMMGLNSSHHSCSICDQSS